MSLAHVNLFDAKLGHGHPSGGSGEFRYICPFCGDPGRTLAVNYVRERFICFKASCAVKGGLSYLAVRLNLAYSDLPLLSSTDQLRNRLWAVDSGVQFNIAPKIEETVKVPELKQIQPSMYAWEYLRSRGLTEHDIYYNELSLSPEDRNTRIYFPHRDDLGRIIYWVARKYLPNHKKGRKYINPGGSIKKTLLYRSSLVDRRYPVSICEGPLSAIAAGNAVATLGVDFSPEQVSAIAGLGSPILAAMDGEAFKYSVKLARKLEPYGIFAGIVPMPNGEDPASLGRATYYECVKSSFYLTPGEIQEIKERMGRLR